jgi:hypothetical protein
MLGSELYYISVPASSRVLTIFQLLKSEYPNAQRVLKRITYQQCTFYKFKNPVIISDDDSNDTAAIQQCLDEDNWIKVSPNKSLKALGSELRNDHVYLVIKPLQLEGTPLLYLLTIDILIHFFR